MELLPDNDNHVLPRITGRWTLYRVGPFRDSPEKPRFGVLRHGLVQFAGAPPFVGTHLVADYGNAQARIFAARSAPPAPAPAKSKSHPFRVIK